MKGFWTRAVSVVLIAGIFSGYNFVLESRAKDEEIARLNFELENENGGAGNASGSGAYIDGMYEGAADGFGGEIIVEVQVEDGVIHGIEIKSAEGEDGAYLTMAQDIITKIVENQSTDIDTISGATFSSTGIREATKKALEKAVE